MTFSGLLNRISFLLLFPKKYLEGSFIFELLWNFNGFPPTYMHLRKTNLTPNFSSGKLTQKTNKIGTYLAQLFGFFSYFVYCFATTAILEPIFLKKK